MRDAQLFVSTTDCSRYEVHRMIVIMQAIMVLPGCSCSYVQKSRAPDINEEMEIPIQCLLEASISLNLVSAFGSRPGCSR